MAQKHNYYDILQISERAEQEVVEAAYKRLALKYHPDKNNSVNATLKMQEINEAYNVLRDPVKRVNYDKTRDHTKTSRPTQEDIDEIKLRVDEEKRKRDELEKLRKKAEQERESFKRYAEEEHLRREKAEKALHKANLWRRKGILILLGVLGIIVGSIVLVIAVNNIKLDYKDTTGSLPTVGSVSVTPKSSSVASKLIEQEAINYIPSITEMPKGFLEDPSSGPLPYANADGYSQIYKNPGNIQLDREVLVGYFTFICADSDNAHKILFDFIGEMTKDINSASYLEVASDPKKIATVDKSYIYYFETNTPSGNYNISYISGIQFSNFIGIVLISAPVNDLQSERTKVIRERLRELGYYYTSLVTQKLPIPKSGQIILPEPIYQRVPPTALP